MAVLQKENGKLSGCSMWFKKPFAYTVSGFLSLSEQNIDKMNFKTTHYGFASVHIGQNLLFLPAPPPLSLGCQLGLIIRD